MDDFRLPDLSPAVEMEDRPCREVLDIMIERRSVRAFSSRPVPRPLIEAVLDAARWAPSGANMQPWSVIVVSGETKEKVTRALLDARAANTPVHPDYAYYPQDWFEPFQSRRMALGVAMYSSQGKRRSAESRQQSWDRNYAFFGAPVGLLFFLDRRFSTGSWLDCGMFLQNVMLAARAYGLETCPQASLADYPDTIRQCLGVAQDQLLLCALSLGYADWDQPVNRFERSRADVSHFTVFHD